MTINLATAMPKPKAKRALVEPPVKSEVPNNMKGERTAPLTFAVPEEWHRRFKSTASANGMTMKELLMEAFDLWEENKKAR